MFFIIKIIIVSQWRTVSLDARVVLYIFPFIFSNQKTENEHRKSMIFCVRSHYCSIFLWVEVKNLSCEQRHAFDQPIFGRSSSFVALSVKRKHGWNISWGQTHRWRGGETLYKHTESVRKFRNHGRSVNMRPVQQSIKILYYANKSEEPFVEVSFEEPVFYDTQSMQHSMGNEHVLLW